MKTGAGFYTEIPKRTTSYQKNRSERTRYSQVRQRLRRRRPKNILGVRTHSAQAVTLFIIR
jgi:hypothetical protein